QAAATLAAVLVGNKIEIAPGVALLNDDVLNGTVVMILFTCIISSIYTERAARKITLLENLDEVSTEDKKEKEKILIPVANPETIENLVNMALLMQEVKAKEGLLGLSVVYDNDTSGETSVAQGKQNLERAAQVAAAADVKMETVSR